MPNDLFGKRVIVGPNRLSKHAADRAAPSWHGVVTAIHQFSCTVSPIDGGLPRDVSKKRLSVATPSHAAKKTSSQAVISDAEELFETVCADIHADADRLHEINADSVVLLKSFGLSSSEIEEITCYPRAEPAFMLMK